MRPRATLVRTAALGTLLGTAVVLAVALRGSAPPVSAPSLVSPEATELRVEQLSRPAISFPAPAPPPPAEPDAVPITFGQPTIAGIQGTAFEPDIRLDPSNPQRIYVSLPGSLSSDDSWIWHSRDGGKTFKWITASHPKVGKPVACAGGGDTELAVDGAGRLYFNDLTLANFSVGRSDDGGTTFVCNNTGVPSTLVDRQWYAIDGDPTALGPSGPTANSLYLASNDVGQGAPQCPVSGAGNNVLTVYRSVPGPLAGLQFLPSFKVAGNGTPAPGTCDEGIMGNIEVSPVATTTGEIGQGPLAQAVKHVYVIHDDATFSKIRIGRCFPVTVGPPVANTSDPSGLRCNDLLISDLGDSTQVRTGANFPSLAIDKAGNLYAVWQQAPVDAGGNILNTSLKYSYSTNEGTTWSSPITIPTPGLLNNVMTWAEAGDDGRVDIVWYGTPGGVNPPGTCELGAVPPPTPRGGPDSVNAVWSLYFTQTTNGHDPAGVAFSPPVRPAGRHNHRGSIMTVMGGFCGNRTAMGDFFKMRIGAQGEANIIYSDANNSIRIGHVMFIRQNGGPGVYLSQAVTGDPVQLNNVSDPAGDGVRELDSTVSPNLANLDILNSTLTRPNPALCHPANTPCYRVQMNLNVFSLSPPAEVAPDQNIVWLTQWLTPSDPACASAAVGCANGGRNFFVYAESDPALGLRCFFGELSIQAVGGGVTLTYPPVFLSGQITAAGACATTLGANGTVTIEVPVGSVSLEAGVAPLDPDRLFSVTASTMTLNAASDSVPALGIPPDVIDVARSYDAVFIETAVAVRSFTAKRHKQTVTLRWRTGSEAGLAGFNVYRQRGAARVRLNRVLIPASGGPQGKAYLWRVRGPAARYWLQWVRTDGSKVWYGPARSQ